MSANNIQLPRRLLTPSEKAGLKQRIKDHEEDTSRRETNENYTPERVDDPIEAATVRRQKRILERDDPSQLSFTPGERARMNERIRELTARLQKLMVPKSHINLRASPDPEFRKAVNEMAKSEMSQGFQQMAQEYKRLMRALHPDDPNAGNLEFIRPQTR